MRIGIVIKLRPECIESYKKLHKDNHPGVRDLLTHYNLFNFSIFLHKIGDEFFEFGYYEYRGENFESEMEALANEPRNKAWLEICNPMQIPLPGEKGWAIMEQIYYNDANK